MATLCLFSFSIAQVPTSKKIILETGVSEKLAIYRKAVLKDINYTLHFYILNRKEDPVVGIEFIDFSLLKNSQPLQIDFKEEGDPLSTIQVNGRKIPIHFEKEHIIISPQYLNVGKNGIIITFRASDLSLNRNDDYLYTLLVPDRARTLFPCFDQPDLKAIFKLIINMPEDWSALSNAPLVSSLPEQGMRTYRYQPSDKISTYLFSFAAGKFQKLLKRTGGRDMNFYHRETDSSKIKVSIPPIFQIHNDALKFLEQYTSIPFPFKKFDFVAIPDFQYNGMEHVGAIQYRANSMFLDSGATRDEEINRSNLIAHETSHMWFGDLVTMSWFNDVWMKEVFANFIADKITQVAIPNMNFNHKFLLDHFPAAYSIDRTTAPNPIRQKLENLDQAGSLYGNIIYHKAPIMMRQLEMLMGKDAFRNGLREYLKTYAHSNATWPQLIRILDRYTKADLLEWNKIWVDEQGRPAFDYELKLANGKIEFLLISQKGEDGSPRVWPQLFEILLVYPDRHEQITVKSTSSTVQLKEVVGKSVPSFILFNTTGKGYGLFPVDTFMFPQFHKMNDPVVRASAYVNLYENMLNNKVMTPMELVAFYRRQLSYEQEELNLRLITNYLSDIFWKYISPAKRNQLSKSLEPALWNSMMGQSTANKKKVLFRAFQSIALSKPALDSLFGIWKNQFPPAGLMLAEDDYSALALMLALKDYPGDILQEQLTRIKNPDRQKRFRFSIPALSADVKTRDDFFASLRLEQNREKEAWVVSALQYLHHPLRAASSRHYIKESLEMLEEIQSTGDIFFPQNWLQATLGSYQDSEVADMVREFLAKHPGYNPKLRMKILQNADGLFRAEKLVVK